MICPEEEDKEAEDDDAVVEGDMNFFIVLV
jgi:hypothetical protein